MLKNTRNVRMIGCLLIGALVYALPVPDGLSADAWKIFAIFLSTIALVMLDVFPMAAASLMGLTAAVVFKSMDFATAFNGFTSPITWLILSAFFISFGFVHTGLGRRIALRFIAAFGKNALGLAYGIGLTEFVLAPGTPSSTARTGGIIYPIVESISRSFKSFPRDDSAHRLGCYLVLCLYNFTVVTSAMFMTAMAANPFVAKLAHRAGVEISWWLWAKAAFLPGLVNLFLIPLVLLRLCPQTIRNTPHAAEEAKTELAALGPMSSAEKLMALGFVVLMILWIFGPLWDISAVIAALLGLAFLLFFGVFTWDQLLKLHNAFETFIWFGALLALSDGLSSTGFTEWFGLRMANSLGSWPALLGITTLFLVYFYSHYFFASATAHVGAMFLPFIGGAVALGAPLLPTALAFSFASSLFGSLTHYGLGPAPILFGSGYVTVGNWWRVGLIMSIVNILSWSVISIFWWWVLGIW